MKKRLYGAVAVVLLLALAVWVDIPQHPSFTLGQVYRDLEVKLGLDLRGGSHLIYRATIEDDSIEDATEALAGVRDVIERRVNAFGISEPNVQTNHVGDEYRVIVELAGVHDPQEAIKMIGETPQLDFRVEFDDEEMLRDINVDGITGAGPLFARTELSGKHLKRSTVSFDQTSNTPQVNLQFDSEGSDLFAEITKENLGKRVAIYLDGIPISAPVVQAEITNGQAVISGGFDLVEAKELVRSLNAGALPVPVELIGQSTIGPSLGRLSIQQSLQAGAIGFVLVMIGMILFW